MGRRLGVVMAVAVAVLALGAASARAYVAGDGKGKPEADCLIGLEGYDDGDLTPFGKKGKPAIQCTDCDPACDLDGIAEPNGSCLFSIAVRVNDAGVPACTPAALKKVKVKAKTKGTKITSKTDFQVALDGSSVTSAFVNFPVLVKKFGTPKEKLGKGKVKLFAKKLEKPKLKDKDKFLFVCNPLPEGEVCPGGTTSTTLGSTSTTLESTTTTMESSTTTVVTTTSSSTTIGTIVLPGVTTTTVVLPVVTIVTTTTSTTIGTIVLPGVTTTTVVLPVVTIVTTTTSTTIGTIVLPGVTTTVVLPVITIVTTTTSTTFATILPVILTTTTIVLLPTI